jgi:hypothetical protein
MKREEAMKKFEGKWRSFLDSKENYYCLRYEDGSSLTGCFNSDVVCMIAGIHKGSLFRWACVAPGKGEGWMRGKEQP